MIMQWCESKSTGIWVKHPIQVSAIDAFKYFILFKMHSAVTAALEHSQKAMFTVNHVKNKYSKLLFDVTTTRITRRHS